MRKELENRSKQSEDYTHFPFTSGELIEAHRQAMGNVMRDDLKNFIQSKQASKSFAS